jgi:glycosyltransferase involved in cell wall biosynthesis
MAERKHITLLYQYNENWIAGAYYILNIIKALKIIEDQYQPKITILYDDKGAVDAVKNIEYPYIDYVPYNSTLPLYVRLLNFLSYLISSKVPFKKKLPGDRIENIYPMQPSLSTKNVRNSYVWIPDFQEHYLAHFFSKMEVKMRRKYQEDIVKLGCPVVFSSQNALEDFRNFYPDNSNETHVLHFVSIIGDAYKALDIETIRKQYSITKPYFIVTNQFWSHKNHLIAIKGFELLLNEGHDIQLVLTGKQHDHRDPEYTVKIKEYIVLKGLEDKVLLLGFIDRDEQLSLMKNSLAIIQPSLFEGWSTVVEDAKALNKFIAVSDIPLHREQIKSNCVFFAPNDEKQLSEVLRKLMIEHVASNEFNESDHSFRIKKFANEFIAIFR